MNFWLPLSSTFIGVILGFFLSLLTFFIKEKRIGKIEKTILLMNFGKELEFDILVLEKFINELNEIKLAKIFEPQDYKNIDPLPKFIDYRNYFTERFLAKDFLYERLNIEDVLYLSEMSRRLSGGICLADLKKILNDFTKYEFLEEIETKWNNEKEKILKYVDTLKAIRRKLKLK